MYTKEDIEKAKQYLDNEGYGTGSNFTLNAVANLMAEYAAKNCVIPAVSSRLLLRIASDLQKELVRQTDDMVKADLETQIEGLKALHKEVEDYRTIKRLLNGC